MNWGNPYFLYFLLIVPILIFIIFIDFKRKRISFNAFAEQRFFKFFMADFSLFHWNLKNSLLIFVIIILTIAIAKPRWGKEVQLVKKEGLDIVVAIDVSKSMDAQDIAPSRIERAKEQISQFVSQLNGDRVALVAFAGESFVSCPLTDDYEAYKMFLNLLDTNMTTAHGTDIGIALETSNKLFGSSHKYKIIVLISDGEDLEENAVNVAKKIGEDGAIIYTLGVGSPEGTTIPIEDENGNIQYAKKENGEIIMTRLDVEMLSRIAEAGNGKFYPVTPQQAEIFEILKNINSLEKQKFDAKEFSRYKEQYAPFVIIALLVLIIEYMINYKRKIKKIRVIED